jgi:hypothetical protein
MSAGSNQPSDDRSTAILRLVKHQNSLLKAATSEIDTVGSRYAAEMKPVLKQMIDEVISFTDLKLGPIEIDVSDVGTTTEGLRVVGATHITKQGVQKNIHVIDGKGFPHTIETETISTNEFVARIADFDIVAAVTDKIFCYLKSTLEGESGRGPYA